MNVGFDFDFPRGLEFYSLDPFTFSGNSYIPRIANLSSLRLAIGENHNFEVSNMEVVFQDQDGHFKAMMTDPYNKYFLGRNVTLRKQDGTAIRLFYIENGYPGKGSEGTDIFTFVLSDQVNELNQNIIETIDENYFPNAEYNTAYGQVIPRIYRNNELLSETTMIKCWHVNKTHGTTDYIASSKEINVITRVEDSGGSDRTGIASIQIEDGLYYIKLSNPIDGEYVLLNAQPTTIDTPYEVIADLMNHYFINFGGDSFSDEALETWLDKNDYRQYFAIGEQMTGVELLKAICDSFQLDWHVNGDRKIVFTWIDPNDLTPDKTYLEAEISNFKIDRIDPELMANRFICYFGYNNKVGSYEQVHVFDFEKNQDKYGIFEKELYLRFLDTWSDIHITRPIGPWKTVKKHFWTSKYPKIIARAEIRDDLIIDYYPGDMISFEHENALNAGERLYQIRSIDYDFMNDAAYIILWDCEYLNNLRSADKLLIHSDTEANSSINLDSAVDGWHYPYIEGGTVHRINAALFGNTSMYFSDKYLKWLLDISTNESFDMASVTNFTCDFWCKFAILPISSDDCMLAAYNSGDATNDYWEIEIDNGYRVKFNYVDGGASIIALTSTATINTDWHHYAICKVGSDIGVYLDGTQILYTNISVSSINADAFILGKNPNLGNWGTINLDEVHVSHDNFFAAAPAAGLTDVIIPMNEPYNDESVNMESDNARLLENYYPRLLETGEERLLE